MGRRLAERRGGSGGEGVLTPRASLPAGRRLGVCAAAALLAAAWAPPAAAQVSVRGFVQASHLRFTASRSIEATTGSPAGAAWGGGGQVGFGRLFVQGSVERYAADGRRVFVLGDQVFDLGIPNRIAITPVQLTAGYRTGSRIAAYGGGGIGVYRFAESAPFGPRAGGSEAASDGAVVPPLGPPYGDDVRETHRSWHVLGGVETPLLPWLWIGGEGQWTWVPGALGAAGVSAAFDETDLGGLALRVKLSAGF